jgi:hypothetical protein
MTDFFFSTIFIFLHIPIGEFGFRFEDVITELLVCLLASLHVCVCAWVCMRPYRCACASGLGICAHSA